MANEQNRNTLTLSKTLHGNSGRMCGQNLFFQKIRAGDVPGADPSWDNRGEALRRNHALFYALPYPEKMELAREAQCLTAPYAVARNASVTAALANKLNSLRKKENQRNLEGMPGGGTNIALHRLILFSENEKWKTKMNTRNN